MTVRLLRAFNGIPTNSIVTLDAPTETALVRQFAASLTLTGGVPYTGGLPFDLNPSPAPNIVVSSSASVDADGRPDGTIYIQTT